MTGGLSLSQLSGQLLTGSGHEDTVPSDHSGSLGYFGSFGIAWDLAIGLLSVGYLLAVVRQLLLAAAQMAMPIIIATKQSLFFIMDKF